MTSNANRGDTTGRLNLLDRLLEVAKDFEAERFQDEVEHKKQVRSLEQQVRTLRETSENRLNEITYLETKLGKAKPAGSLSLAFFARLDMVIPKKACPLNPSG